MAVAPVTGPGIVTIRVDRFRLWLPQLVHAIAMVGDVTPEALAGPVRTRILVMLRQACAFAARDGMAKSYAEIGHALGGRDHSTLTHAYQRAQERIRADGEFRQLATVALAIARTIATGELTVAEVEPELPL